MPQSIIKSRASLDLRTTVRFPGLVQADRQQGRTLFAMKPTGLKDHHAWTIEFLDGFKEKLTPSKWTKIAQCSQDLAIRDIQGLTERGIVMKEAAGGRSTNYGWKESGS